MLAVLYEQGVPGGLHGSYPEPRQEATMSIMPQRAFGTTGAHISIIGLGGGGGGMNPQILGSPDKPHIQALAEQIIHRALDAGINLFDTCSGYGASERILGRVAASRRSEMFLATKNLIPHASGDQVRRELEQSLTRLQTDHVDLVQIHDIYSLEQADRIFAPDHAIEVYLKAREEGLTRFIGITSHNRYQPLVRVLDRCAAEGIRMDSVLMGFSVADRAHGGYGKRLLVRYPDVTKLAMTIFGCDGAPVMKQTGYPAETLIRYVLSHPFASAVIGMHTIEELEENVAIAKRFVPYTEPELQAIEAAVDPTKVTGGFVLT
jgi:aryl-alcohol dehydrogenase-like predicted oxidoreductase